MKTKEEILEQYWNEVSSKMNPEDYDGDIEFSVRHGMISLAVFLWCGTGASDFKDPCPVSFKVFRKECHKLELLCDRFECLECNHQGLYDKGQHETINWCYSCGDNTVKRPRAYIQNTIVFKELGD